jgi:hypothetical protein
MCHLSDKGQLITYYLPFIIAHFYDLLTTSSIGKLAMIRARVEPELKTIRKTDAGEELNEYASIDEFKKKMGI